MSHPLPQARAALSRSLARLLGAALVLALAVWPALAAPRAQATVPVPGAGQAVITVKVGGDRNPDGSVKGLAGVRLGLFGSGTASAGATNADLQQGSPGPRHDPSWSWTTCTSDADGDCSFVIPIRGGAVSSTGVPQDTRFWVAQESSPAGWFDNPRMRLGSFGATPEYNWAYRFRTASELRAGVTYRSTDPLAVPGNWLDPTEPDRGFMRNREDTNTEGGQMAQAVGRTTGIWSQSRTNPALPAKCGLNVAVVVDTSGSLQTTGGFAPVAEALDTFVDAFRGTTTKMSAFSFSRTSPGSGATNHPALLPVTTSAQAAAFKGQYDSWVAGGGTNWDRGLAAAARSGTRYDLVVLLTDGNPTLYGDTPDAGASAANSYQDVDAGIFSANQLKADGSRVVALGVGSAVSSPASALNLRAVSGGVENSDYFRAADFTEAADLLADLAKANCEGGIQVQKMIVPAGGTVADATQAPAGWEFDATSTSPGVQVVAPSSATTVTGGNGRVDFGLSFTNPTTSGQVQVVETQQTGYEVLPVSTSAGVRNARCVNTETGDQVAVVDAGTAATPGFSTTGFSGALVLCTIYNRKSPPAPGSLEIEKSSDPVSGTAIEPGGSVEYTLTFRNTGGSPVGVDHDDVLTDVLDDADVSGITTSDPALSAVRSGDRISVTGTVPAGATYTVSYTVTVSAPTKQGGNGVLNNYLVPDGQSPPASCDVDTKLCTSHPIPGDVSVAKEASGSATPLKPGDDVTYTLTFTHSGGEAASVDYEDSLADVLDDATLIDGPNVSDAALAATLDGVAPNQTIRIVGVIAKGAPVIVTYTVRIRTSGLGDATLANCVTERVTPPNPVEDEDEVPVQAAADQACTSTDVPGALAYEKTSDPVSGTPVVPGQPVDYTLTFRNVGGTPMVVDHTDLLAGVLDDATIVSGPSATGGLTVTPSPLGTATSFDVAGTLAGGATGTVTYRVQVKATGLGDGVLDNFLVRAGEEPPPTCAPAPGQSRTCTTHPVPGDLAVTKASDPVSGTEVSPGEEVAYTLTFVNGGGAPSAVDYTDYLAAVLDDADFVAGSLQADSGLNATLAGDGRSFRVTGSLGAGQTRTVTYTVKVRLAGFGDGNLRNVVRPDGENPPSGPCLASDRLCTEHPVPGDLTVTKAADPISGSEVAPGDVVTYTLRFANVGASPSTVDYTDYLAAVLDDADLVPGSLSAGPGLTATMAPDGLSFAVTGSVGAESVRTVTYRVTVKSADLGDGQLDNFLRPTVSNPPGPGTECLAGDTLCTTHPVPGDLTVRKSADPATGSVLRPGDLITYRLRFENKGGKAVPVDHVDHLADVLDDADITAAPAVVGAADGVVVSPVIDQSFSVAGQLAGGATVVVAYTVRVKASGRGDSVLANFLTPKDEHPPVTCDPGVVTCTEHPVTELVADKSVSPASGSIVVPGQELAYTLRFANIGGIAAEVAHRDLLADVLDDATVTVAPAFVGAGGGLSIAPIAAGGFSVTGELAANTTVLVRYTVMVKPAEARGDSVLTNFLVKSGENPPECVPESTLCTQNPVGELSVVKSVDPAHGTAVTTGDLLTYSLTFANAGASSQRIDHTDHLDDVLDDADLVVAPSIAGEAHGLRVSAPASGSFTITGDLAARSTVVVSYRVKVKAAAERGDSLLDNYLVSGDEDPPTKCDDGPLCTENPVGDFSVTKTSDPATGTKVRDGEVVRFTLTFRNTGALAHAVDYTDHLKDVLDDGLLISSPRIVGAAHGLAATGLVDEKFTVSGNLAGRQQVSVSYQVKVHRTGRGNDSLVNFLVEGDAEPPKACVSGVRLCTVHPVPPSPPTVDQPDPGWLPNTGGPALAALLAGLGALLGGVVLLTRRRKSNG